MSGCTDCFNGCSSTTPDKCVKYTGVDHPELDIEKGNSLLTVEENIILKMLSMAIGEGINPTIDPLIICVQLQTNLPLVGPYTLNDYITALIKTTCANGSSINSITNILTALNSPYNMLCITGVSVPNQSITHIVVQAIIDTLCTLNASFNTLVNNLPATYVALADLDNLIADYLATTAPADLISSKMIPMVAMPYFGSLTFFNATGVGQGTWDRVFLCNGANGTPDLRGRALVGVTDVVGAGTYAPAVDPNIAGNPNYILNTPEGQNTVTLTKPQMPVHTHTATVEVDINDPGHTHPFPGSINRAQVDDTTGTDGNIVTFTTLNTDVNATGLNDTNVIVTVTNSNEGGGQSHPNIQPVLPCNFIMYIPL